MNPSSFTDVHRFIDYRNPNWHSLSKSVRLTYLSVYDISRALRSFGFLHVWPGLVPATWPLERLLGLLLFVPSKPSIYETFDRSILVFSLLLYRHPFIYILFSSRFTPYNFIKKYLRYRRLCNTQITNVYTCHTFSSWDYSTRTFIYLPPSPTEDKDTCTIVNLT